MIETPNTTPAKPPVWAFVEIAIFILAITLLLTGCTTVEDADGVRTSRFDPAAAAELIRLGTSTYDRYNPPVQ